MLSNIFLFLVSAHTAFSATLYVSLTGSDTAAGSFEAPFKSIQVAVDQAVAGDTIYLRAGTYSLTANIQIKKSGTAAKPFTLSAYTGEKVIIDGEGLPYTPGAVDSSIPSASRGILHIQAADYWKFYNLELINGPYGIYHVDSSNNYYERIITRDNYETGFQMQGASAKNTVLYLDSYGNRDPRKTERVLMGARLWNNVDDGLDLWEFKSGVTIEDTISWGNGVNRWGFSPFSGDGNGFKLGGGGSAAEIGPANHVITNSIAFNNAAKGFTDNSQTGTFTLTRNTAWNNGDSGFKMATAQATLKNNIAALNANSQTSFSGTQTQSGNSWNVGGTWNNASFLSVSSTSVTATRASSGKIVGSNFLLPTSGAALGATTYW